MLPADIHVPLLGSYNSALDNASLAIPFPPATRIFPLFSGVIVELLRAVFMLPVAVHVPGVCDGAVVADIPVGKIGFRNESAADLVNPSQRQEETDGAKNKTD